MTYEPRYLPVEPPPGVAALRAGVTCHRDPIGHPRAILTARSWRQLDRATREWRCGQCSSPGWGEWSELRDDQPRRPAPAEPRGAHDRPI